MSKSINILDTDYIQWIKELSCRYRRSQIKVKHSNWKEYQFD